MLATDGCQCMMQLQGCEPVTLHVALRIRGLCHHHVTYGSVLIKRTHLATTLMARSPPPPSLHSGFLFVIVVRCAVASNLSIKALLGLEGGI